MGGAAVLLPAQPCLLAGMPACRHARVKACGKEELCWRQACQQLPAGVPCCPCALHVALHVSSCKGSLRSISLPALLWLLPPRRVPSSLLQRIFSVQYEMPPGLPISPECLDIIRRILMRNPAERITLQQIQQHPWYQAVPPAAAPAEAAQQAQALQQQPTQPAQQAQQARPAQTDAEIMKITSLCLAMSSGEIGGPGCTAGAAALLSAMVPASSRARPSKQEAACRLLKAPLLPVCASACRGARWGPVERGRLLDF